MKIFPSKENTNSAVKQNENGPSKPVKNSDPRMIHHSGPRKRLSDQEIREKIDISKLGKREKFNKAKSVAPFPLDDGPKDDLTKEKIAPALDEKKTIGDVGLNDPNDDMTKEKLKTLIQNDGFSFSDKERDALSKILK